LEVSGSAFRAWRQVAAGAVGHFGGELTEEESDRLAGVVHACESADPAPPSPPRPGASVVHVDIDGTSISYGSGSAPPGPWAHLDRLLASLCDAVTDRPTAAIAIAVFGSDARLEHRGADPIRVDLTSAEFVAVAWRGWYEEAARTEGALAGASEDVGPGWSTPVPIGDLPTDGTTVHVRVRFVLGSGADATPVELAYAPDLPPPPPT
jgi:hypothetical protein